MFARYRSVLTLPGSARLLATGVLARLPQGMSALTILLLVRGATHSYTLAGLATGGEALAAAAAGPWQGRLVDRHGRVRVLAPWALCQAALYAGLVLVARPGGPGGALVLIACAIGAAQPAIAPSVRALLQSVVPAGELRESAYALESVIQELIWISGPLLVALALAVGSPALAALLCAALALFGTLLFLGSPTARARPRSADAGRRRVLEALPGLPALLVPVGLMGVAIGATEVGLPSLALHAGARSASGLLLAVWSLGSVIGGLAYGARSWRVPLVTRYRRLLAAAVVCAAPLTFAGSVGVGLAGALLTGLTIAPVFSCQYAFVSEALAGEGGTEAFTWMSSALIAGVAAGSALGGALISPAGTDAPFLLACGALAGAALCATRVRGLTGPGRTAAGAR